MPQNGLEDELLYSDAIILFDGDCAFCRNVVGLLLRTCQEPRLLVCSTRSPRGEAVAKALGGNPVDTFAFVTASRVDVGVSAYAKILKLESRTAWLGWFVGVVPRFVSERIYNWVGDHRQFMSRLLGRSKPTSESYPLGPFCRGRNLVPAPVLCQLLKQLNIPVGGLPKKYFRKLRIT
jgi:predicted DCC family thiol-disulfide oxidoreductase YuxK